EKEQRASHRDTEAQRKEDAPQPHLARAHRRAPEAAARLLWAGGAAGGGARRAAPGVRRRQVARGSGAAAAGAGAAPRAARRHLRPRRRPAGPYPRDVRRGRGPARAAGPARRGPAAHARPRHPQGGGAPRDRRAPQVGGDPRALHGGAAAGAGRSARRAPDAPAGALLPAGRGGARGAGHRVRRRAGAGGDRAGDGQRAARGGRLQHPPPQRAGAQGILRVAPRGAPARRRRRVPDAGLRPAGDRGRGAGRGHPQHQRVRRRPAPHRAAHGGDPGRCVQAGGGHARAGGAGGAVRARLHPQALLRGLAPRRAPRVAQRPDLRRERALDGSQRARAHRRAPVRHPVAARRAARVQQHRNGQAGPQAHPGRAVRQPARLRLRHAHRGRVPHRVVRPPAAPGALVQDDRRLARHGLRGLGDAGADGDGVRRAGQRRQPDGGPPAARDARAGRGDQVADAAAGGPPRRVQAGDGRAARRAHHRGQRRLGQGRVARHLRGGGEDGDGAPHGAGRALRAGEVQRQLRVVLPRARPAARDLREAGPSAGRLLRRPHGGARHPGYAAGHPGRALSLAGPPRAAGHAPPRRRARARRR
ncbi:MAG: Cell division protein FtsI [Peptidoglycan synthetase], partial [uncultured Gemmatimonadetes bacterium]